MQNLVSKKAAGPLSNLLIIVMLVAILMAVFIYYFLKQSPNYQATGFEALKSNFSSKVRIVHSQWLMNKRPRWVLLASSEGFNENGLTEIKIPVNKYGWIDIDGGDEGFKCEKIWQLLMDMPLMILKSPIVALEIQHNQAPFERACRYSISSGETFEYSMKTGNVTRINK